jgi:hypothetical protein
MYDLGQYIRKEGKCVTKRKNSLCAHMEWRRKNARERSGGGVSESDGVGGVSESDGGGDPEAEAPVARIPLGVSCGIRLLGGGE